MSRFTDTQLTTWAQTYEAELFAKFNLYAKRTSIATVVGRSEYELPTDVCNIRAVLYLGKEVHPKNGVFSKMTGDTPFNPTTSTPFEYVFSDQGQRVIKLHPAPDVAIASYVGDLWTATADAAACIVEYYAIPDYTDTFGQLPDWCRRNILKDYVCWKAFRIDGKGQDTRAAKYYEAKIAQDGKYFTKIKDNMHASEIQVLTDSPYRPYRKPGRPVLPPNFGIPVNY